jgi:hypothetical protein
MIVSNMQYLGSRLGLNAETGIQGTQQYFLQSADFGVFVGQQPLRGVDLIVREEIASFYQGDIRENTVDLNALWSLKFTAVSTAGVVPVFKLPARITKP